MRHRLSFVLAALAGSACSSPTPPAAPALPDPVASAPAPSAEPAPTPAASVDERRAALNALIDERWEYQMKRSPEWASFLGDKRYNDRWSDMSPEAIAADLAKGKEFLARFEAIDPAGLSEQDALNRRLSIRELEEQQEDARFEDWLMPVNQFTGVHTSLPQMAAVLSFTTVKDYEDYIKRLDTIGTVFAQTTALMRAGMAKGLMPPRFALERAVPQVDGLSKAKPADSPFAIPVKAFPKDIPAADQTRLRAAVLEAIKTKVLPAYVEFAKFLRDEYVPKGRTEPGEWSLPDGAARYAAHVKSFTTTPMTPDEIHELGVREVERIEAESTAIAKKLGFKDLATFQASVRKNKKLYAKNGAQILALYQKYTDAMYLELPKLFGRLPEQKMKIEAMEAYRAKEAAGADYLPGAPDGSRPGTVRVNTSDATKRLLVDVETTAYHEGVPGHHLQLTIAQEVPGLAKFRKHGYYGAYIEGWGLYSERLGKDVGFYKDPYSEYGNLQAEIMRAIRLVVDTGVHHKKWTRDQVVAYFRAHSTLDEPTVQNETDRYIVWPGQALSYKVGQLTLLRLRDKAREALGDRFDIRAFHDEILGGGALPLDVLEERIDAWIAKQKA